MKTINSFCSLPFTRVKIICNGNIQMCCHQKDRYIGNLLHSSFEECWFSDIAKEIRRETLENKLHDHCNNAHCPFFYKDNLKSHVKEWHINYNELPTELEIDLHISHCNFGGTKADPKKTCIMCPRNYDSAREFMQSLPDRTNELVEKVKFLMPHIQSLVIMGVAEPFWKDKIFEIFDLLDFKNFADNVFFWTNTNGSIFNQERQIKYSSYVKKGLLHFSLDAASSETYLKIRKNNVFDLVCKNLESWNNYRLQINKEQKTNHQVKIYNNINSLNIHELVDMVKLAKKLNVDHLTFGPTIDCNTNPQESSEHVISIMPNTRNYKYFLEQSENAKKVAEELGVNLEFYKSIDNDIGKKLVQISF